MCYDTGGYTVQEILSSFSEKILEIIDQVNNNEEICNETHIIIENIRNEVVPELVDGIIKKFQDNGYFDTLVNVTLIEQLRTELTTLLNQTITDFTTRLDNFDSQLAHIAIDVKSFGAKGDGITDDTQAIQDAINSLENGGVVLIPSGNYYITNSIVIPSNTVIKGNGKSSVLLLNDDISCFITEGVNNKSIGSSEIIIEDIYIKDKWDTPSKTKYTIELANTYNSTLQNITIDGEVGNPSDLCGIYLSKKNEYNGNCFVNRVDNCQLRNSSIKIESSDSYINQCEIWGYCRSYAIHIVKSSVHVTNNQIVGSNINGGVYIHDDIDNFNVELIKVIGNYFDGSYTDINSGIGLIGYNLRLSVISNNQFWKQNKGGIVLNNGYGNVVNSNNFQDCNQDDNFYNDIDIISSTKNILTDNTFSRQNTQTNKGKNINTNTKDNIFSQNIAYTPSQYSYIIDDDYVINGKNAELNTITAKGYLLFRKEINGEIIRGQLNLNDNKELVIEIYNETTSTSINKFLISNDIIPGKSGSQNLGSTNNKFQTLFVGRGQKAIDLNGNIEPTTDLAYKLGTSDKRFHSIYLHEAPYINTSQYNLSNFKITRTTDVNMMDLILDLVNRVTELENKQP